MRPALLRAEDETDLELGEGYCIAAAARRKGSREVLVADGARLDRVLVAFLAAWRSRRMLAGDAMVAGEK